MQEMPAYKPALLLKTQEKLSHYNECFTTYLVKMYLISPWPRANVLRNFDEFPGNHTRKARLQEETDLICTLLEYLCWGGVSRQISQTVQLFPLK